MLTPILRILDQRIARLMLILALVVPMFAVSASADAEEKTVGIGLEFAHGPGLSLKFATSPTSALQFGAHAFDYGLYRARAKDRRYYYGYDYEYGYQGFFVHGEYLSHQGNLVHGRSVSLPWYVGGGADLGLGSGSAAFALHGNLGLALKFHAIPIDIFLEWTPRIWLVDFVQLRATDINGGIRFWF